MTRFSKYIVTASVTFLLYTSAALAFDRDSFLGEWGTEEQCQRALITPTGTKYATPFDIQSDWMSYGDVWCRLIWSPSSPSGNKTYATAKGLCGEDSVRDYQITFEVSGNALTIFWDQWHKNGPLMRCPA